MTAPLLLTVTQTAERLNVSPRTIRRLCERRELQAVRIGRQWRVRAEAVEQMATPSDATPDVAMRHEMSQTGTVTLTGTPEPYRIFRRRGWETPAPAARSGRGG